MPRRSTSYRTPCSWLLPGEQWPDGIFQADAPEVVAYAVEISRLVGKALEGRNKSHVAQEAELDRGTLYALLGGETWADIVTLGKLEPVLQTRLMPDEPPALRRARAKNKV